MKRQAQSSGFPASCFVSIRFLLSGGMGSPIKRCFSKTFAASLATSSSRTARASTWGKSIGPGREEIQGKGSLLLVPLRYLKVQTFRASWFFQSTLKTYNVPSYELPSALAALTIILPHACVPIGWLLVFDTVLQSANHPSVRTNTGSSQQLTVELYLHPCLEGSSAGYCCIFSPPPPQHHCLYIIQTTYCLYIVLTCIPPPQARNTSTHVSHPLTTLTFKSTTASRHRLLEVRVRVLCELGKRPFQHHGSLAERTSIQAAAGLWRFCAVSHGKSADSRWLFYDWPCGYWPVRELSLYRHSSAET